MRVWADLEGLNWCDTMASESASVSVPAVESACIS